MAKDPPDPPDPPDPEDIKYIAMLDYELELTTRMYVPSANEHKRATKEIFNRMMNKTWLKKPKEGK